MVVKALSLSKRRQCGEIRHFVLDTSLIINQGAAGRLSAAIRRAMMHDPEYRKTEIVTPMELGEGCIIVIMRLLQPQPHRCRLQL